MLLPLSVKLGKLQKFFWSEVPLASNLVRLIKKMAFVVVLIE